LSDSNEHLNLSRYLGKIFKFLKILFSENLFLPRGRKDRHDEANSRLSQFYERV